MCKCRYIETDIEGMKIAVLCPYIWGGKCRDKDAYEECKKEYEESKDV